MTTDEKINKYLESITSNVLFIERVNCENFDIEDDIKEEI
jgi:hypothetical protein